MKDGKYAQAGGIAQAEVLDYACAKIKADQDGKLNTTTTTTPPGNTAKSQATDRKKDSIHAITNNNSPNMNDWLASPVLIKCTAKDRLNGFIPDPRDCSKYYRCENNIGMDSLSIGIDPIKAYFFVFISSCGFNYFEGYLMSCVAGLWWDQGRRTCLAPNEVSCDPYKILNDQGSSEYIRQVVQIDWEH